MAIQPHAKVMKSHLRDQARLKPAEVMGPFPIEAEGMRELLIDSLYDLAHSSHPAPEPLGPRRPAIALGRADDLGAVGPPPRRMVRLAFKALVDDIRPTGRGPHTLQARMGMATEDKKRLRQRLILGAGGPTTQDGDHPNRVDGQQEVDAFIPAQPVTPANIGQPWRSHPAPRRLASRVGTPELSRAS